MKAGNVFTVDYPFKFHKQRDTFLGVEQNLDAWLAGCHHDVEDGPEVMDGYFVPDHHFWCDAVGSLSYEVLSIVELVPPLTDRVIFRKTYNYPDGRVRRFAPQLMTVSLLKSRIETPFKVDYEVDPSANAIEELTRINNP